MNSPDTTVLIANYLEKSEDQALLRWREWVKSDPEQASQRVGLDDKELEDHLPALMNDLIKALRGEAAPGVEEEGRRHGHQRRVHRYSVVDVLWELTTFREVVLNLVDEAASSERIDEIELKIAQSLLRKLLDRSIKASVEEYMREAEDERDMAAAEAKQLHEQRDRFLASLSHELRNHIAPIITAVRLLRDIRLPDPRQQRAIGIIDRQAHHQAVLIDELLDINRIRYGKIELKKQMGDVREAVKLAVESCQSAIESKGLELDVDLPSRPITAMIDHTRIAQVATNLLTNSVKFTPPRGHISITLAREEHELILSVRDTGIGVEKQHLTRVFEMFYQSDASIDRTFAGLGIGLTIAKQLVELHGGILEACSLGVGQGAEFVAHLPVYDPVNVRDRDDRREHQILLVEDNPDHLQVLSDALSILGNDVVEATNGIDALRIAAESKPQACIIDIGLPGMDGYELARKLRVLPEMKGALLIALTGYGTAENKSTAEAAGFDYHFTKPADIDKIQNILITEPKSRLAKSPE